MKTLPKISIQKSPFNLFITTLLISSVLFLTSCEMSDDSDDDLVNNNQLQEESTTDNAVQLQDKVSAPDFKLLADNGDTIALECYKNKVLVIFFFGNECPSCKATAPKIEKDLVQKNSGNKDFVLIGIDTWDGNTASVQSFRSSTGVTFPLLVKGSATAKSYGTTYDRLLVIDRDGFIVHKGTSLASNDLTKVSGIVDGLLAK